MTPWRNIGATRFTATFTTGDNMEHQSFNRGELIPKDAQEFLTEQPDPPVQQRMAALAIDAVRCAGWWAYDRPEQ